LSVNGLTFVENPTRDLIALDPSWQTGLAAQGPQGHVRTASPPIRAPFA